MCVLFLVSKFFFQIDFLGKQQNYWKKMTRIFSVERFHYLSHYLFSFSKMMSQEQVPRQSERIKNARSGARRFVF